MPIFLLSSDVLPWESEAGEGGRARQAGEGGEGGWARQAGEEGEGGAGREREGG